MRLEPHKQHLLLAMASGLQTLLGYVVCFSTYQRQRQATYGRLPKPAAALPPTTIPGSDISKLAPLRVASPAAQPHLVCCGSLGVLGSRTCPNSYRGC